MRQIRQFYVNEYCSWILSQNSQHNCIITIGIEGDIDSEKLNIAVKIASIEQPHLRYGIWPNTCGFALTNNPLLIKEINQDIDWRVIAENELSRQFLDGEVLARITVLKNKMRQYIIFCFHHIIGDGTSSINFLLQIIRIYNRSKACPANSAARRMNEPLTSFLSAAKP